MNQDKGGRPPLEEGARRKITSISLTKELQIQLRRLGGSKWIREQIERATDESANRAGLVGQPDVPLGKETASG